MRREFALTLEGVTYKVVVDGNSILVDSQPFVVGFEGGGGPDPSRVLVDGAPHDVRLEGDQAVVSGIAYALSVEGLEEEQVGPRAAPAEAVGEGVVTAIMPGKIMRVLVAEGDEVAEGDVVCILEAMKMENELKAPKAGTITALYAQAGQDVETGAVLAEVE